MEGAFGGSDAEGFWSWKEAYEAAEAAQILFMRKYGRAMQAHAGSLSGLLSMIGRVAGLLPTQTRRTLDSEALQQFSTPLPLALVVAIAAGIMPGDVVLEPSAGTGMLAVCAEFFGARLALNEIGETRLALLGRLFPGTPLSRHDAANIHDRLDPAIKPSIILINPPFSATLHVERRMRDTALRHLGSAFARLLPGGRLVAITGAGLAPDNPAWGDAFRSLQAEGGQIHLSCAIDGAVYARHGTNFATRLTVIDKVAGGSTAPLPPSGAGAKTVADLLARVAEHVPARTVIPDDISIPATVRPVIRPVSVTDKPPPAAPFRASEAVELDYQLIQWQPAEGGDLTDSLYEGYVLQAVRIPVAKPHPTKLVQSVAMASVAPPHPAYRPHLPAGLIELGILSDAQCESIIYAGEAHTRHLVGSWVVDAGFDTRQAAPDAAENAVRFRRGWFLGDGTGCGKGRQVAGILLDNWIKGRRKALWISKSDKLIEDAQRDWMALGQERLLVQPLSRFKQGMPIRLTEGILFCTYATLRSAEREGKASRLHQIVDWLGSDFTGVIVFDEAHALANAAGSKGERGEILPSQQGRAGLGSATGITEPIGSRAPFVRGITVDPGHAGGNLSASARYRSAPACCRPAFSSTMLLSCAVRVPQLAGLDRRCHR